MFSPMSFEMQVRHVALKQNNCVRSCIRGETGFSITCINQIIDPSIKDDFYKERL